MKKIVRFNGNTHLADIARIGLIGLAGFALALMGTALAFSLLYL